MNANLSLISRPSILFNAISASTDPGACLFHSNGTVGSPTFTRCTRCITRCRLKINHTRSHSPSCRSTEFLPLSSSSSESPSASMRIPNFDPPLSREYGLKSISSQQWVTGPPARPPGQEVRGGDSLVCLDWSLLAPRKTTICSGDQSSAGHDWSENYWAVFRSGLVLTSSDWSLMSAEDWSPLHMGGFSWSQQGPV